MGPGRTEPDPIGPRRSSLREHPPPEGFRKQALIINLPGQPKAIRETLEGLKDDTGKPVVSGIFAAVPYCVDLIGGPYLTTNEAVVKAFRPKGA